MRAHGELHPLRWVGVGQLQLQFGPGAAVGLCSWWLVLLRQAQLAIQARQDARGKLCFELACGRLAYPGEQSGGVREAFELFQDPDSADAGFGVLTTSVDVESSRELV